MRAEDRDPFTQLYPADTGADDPTQDGFARACGVLLPSVSDLASAIAADRDAASGGIGWWVTHPTGDRRRILITDALLQATNSITLNLIEARLHQLEARSYADAVSDANANAVRLVDDDVIVKMPPRTSGMDDMATHMLDLHQAGFFRAIGSAVDCLAAAVVGVGALPANLVRSDLDRARRLARRSVATHPLAQRLTTTIDDAEANAGPPGWLPWATDYRNMLVHRARRMNLAQFARRGRRPLFDGSGAEIVRVDSIHQLAQDPGRSDIEMFLAHAWAPEKNNGAPIAPVLEERAEATIDGILDSTKRFVEAVGAELVSIWDERRANPNLASQPRAQWPDIPSSPPTGFEGYDRGAFAYSPDLLVSNPHLHHRMLTSRLLGDFASTWDSLDGGNAP